MTTTKIHEIKTVLLEKARIDKDRVLVSEDTDGLVFISIKNCTRAERQKASNWLQAVLPLSMPFRVVGEAQA